MNQSKTCLNCEIEINGNYCSNCGQKTNYQRITIKNFIINDIVHGIWHFEKGIFFTIRESILRPGQAALDYIGGKRIKYYNVFYLSIILIGLNLFLIQLYHKFNVDINISVGQDDTPKIKSFFADNVKFILFSIVPTLSLNAYVFFKRMNLNLAEHFIIAGICLLGILLIAILYCFISFLNNYESCTFFGILELLLLLTLILFPIWTYYNAIKNQYSILESSWRLFLFQVLILIEIVMFITLLVLYLTNGKGDFNITI